MINTLITDLGHEVELCDLLITCVSTERDTLKGQEG